MQKAVFSSQISLGNATVEGFLIAGLLCAFNLPICLRNLWVWDVVFHASRGHLTSKHTFGRPHPGPSVDCKTLNRHASNCFQGPENERCTCATIFPPYNRKRQFRSIKDIAFKSNPFWQQEAKRAGTKIKNLEGDCNGIKWRCHWEALCTPNNYRRFQIRGGTAHPGQLRSIGCEDGWIFLMLNSKRGKCECQNLYSYAWQWRLVRNMSRSVQHLVCKKDPSKNHCTPWKHVAGSVGPATALDFCTSCFLTWNAFLPCSGIGNHPTLIPCFVCSLFFKNQPIFWNQV